MTYKTRRTDNCTERIDAQAKLIADKHEEIKSLNDKIKRLEKESSDKSVTLIKASKQIVQLQNEKADLTQTLNKLSRRENMRSDQNWDSHPREKSWEL